MQFKVNLQFKVKSCELYRFDNVNVAALLTKQ